MINYYIQIRKLHFKLSKQQKTQSFEQIIMPVIKIVKKYSDRDLKKLLSDLNWEFVFSFKNYTDLDWVVEFRKNHKLNVFNFGLLVYSGEINKLPTEDQLIEKNKIIGRCGECDIALTTQKCTKCGKYICKKCATKTLNNVVLCPTCMNYFLNDEYLKS